jgi:soluble lytic murein transglycosylase-like protein
MRQCLLSIFPWFPARIVRVVLIFLIALSSGLLAQTHPAMPTAPAPAAPTVSAPALANAPAATSPPDANNPPSDSPAAKLPPTAAELQHAAIVLQRAASRKQAENLGLWLMPLEDRPRLAAAAGPPDCDPIDDKLIGPLIEDAAKQQSLEPKLIRAVIDRESAFRPCAVSSKGAQGLMQLMPETATELGVANPFDPKQSVDGGARYLKQLLDKYKGDLPQALGAYNSGPRTMENSGGVPDSQETRDYVDFILSNAGMKPAGVPPPPTAKPPAAAAVASPTAPAIPPPAMPAIAPPTAPAVASPANPTIAPPPPAAAPAPLVR